MPVWSEKQARTQYILDFRECIQRPSKRIQLMHVNSAKTVTNLRAVQAASLGECLRLTRLAILAGLITGTFVSTSVLAQGIDAINKPSHAVASAGQPNPSYRDAQDPQQTPSAADGKTTAPDTPAPKVTPA